VAILFLLAGCAGTDVLRPTVAVEAEPPERAAPDPALVLTCDETEDHMQQITVTRGEQILFEAEAGWGAIALEQSTGVLTYYAERALEPHCPEKRAFFDAAVAWFQRCWPHLQKAVPELAEVAAPPCDCDGLDPYVTVERRVNVLAPSAAPELTGRVSCECAS